MLLFQMRLLCLSYYTFITVFGVLAQVHSDKPLVFTSIDSLEAQVYNLGFPNSTTSASNTYSIQSGKMVFDSVNQGNTILVSLSPALTNYAEGTRINIRVDTANTGPVTVNVNGLGPISMVKGVNQPLDSNEIVQFEVISVVYDGVNFQLINTMHNECPLGFVEANADYCIEIDEHPATHFWNALNTCKELSATLCTFPDWYYACQKTGLGLNDMTSNYEWVGDSFDHAYTATKAGESGCDDFRYEYVYTTSSYHFPFRCCYYKKR